MSGQPKSISISPITYSAVNILASQNRGSAGALTVNGSLASSGVVSLANAYKVDLVSTGDLSGKNFTITGTDWNGVAQSESMAGPNNNTVTSTKYYKTITGISVDATMGGVNLTAGASNSLISQVVPVDIYAPTTKVAVDVVSGTIVYSVEKCYERPTAGETPNFVDGGLLGLAVDSNVTLNEPIGAIRLVINSYSSTPSITFRIQQVRYY